MVFWCCCSALSPRDVSISSRVHCVRPTFDLSLWGTKRAPILQDVVVLPDHGALCLRFFFNTPGRELETSESLRSDNQGPLNGGVSNRGVSRSGLVLPFLSSFGTFPIFLGFSRFARGWSGDFPDLSFSSFSAF